MQEVVKIKEKAANLFKLKDYLKALNLYEEALHLVNERT